MANKQQKDASTRRRGSYRRTAKARTHRRVRARRIVPGARYKITKRCVERRFFLLADRPEVTQLIGYCLGLCLERFDMKLHSACFMSNHYHLDVTDTHGNMPAFKCMLNAFIARGINCLRGRFDRFWSGDRTCDVELVADEETLERMAYTLANPVEAGLVRRSTRWVGLTTAGQRFGAVMKFERPEFFFDANNPDVPEEVGIRIVRPEVMKSLSDDELLEQLERAVRELEQDAVGKLRKLHRRFLGERRVRRQKWRRRPQSFEPRFNTVPKVASRNRWARIAALQRNAAWEAAYAQAYETHTRGEPAVFPYGTYAMRRFGAGTVAPAPS